MFINRSLFLTIPLAGILISGVFLLAYGNAGTEGSFTYIIHGMMMTAGIWLGCMTIVVILWKKFPWEESPILHLIIEIILIVAYTLLFSWALYSLEKRYWHTQDIDSLGVEILVTLLITFFITALHESIFFYRQWKFNFSKSIRLEKDNIEARYDALRAQVNPHFLFNSLNSLTTMAGDNKEVVDYIRNLSDLLRYMLKSGEKELVLLRDEISILNNYLNLQRLRFPGTLNITLDVPESYYHFAIPPLVLQMLTENCIKHNIISREKPLSIEIRAGKDSITVSNKLQRKTTDLSTGQGLKNIKGRYRFFTSRKVDIEETADIFRVTVPLLHVEL